LRLVYQHIEKNSEDYCRGSFSFAQKDSRNISVIFVSLVIRLILQQNTLPLEQLSLISNKANKFMAVLKHLHGMIIFTDPTGSGKTMNSLLLKISRGTLLKLLQWSFVPGIKNLFYAEIIKLFILQ
jgi:hypothetical protein